MLRDPEGLRFSPSYARPVPPVYPATQQATSRTSAVSLSVSPPPPVRTSGDRSFVLLIQNQVSTRQITEGTWQEPDRATVDGLRFVVTHGLPTERSAFPGL